MSDPYAPIWCRRCETHMALPHQQLCPVCLDDRDRERRNPK